MKERIRIGVSETDELDLDFFDGRVPEFCDIVIGLHHGCGGFITRIPTSRGNNLLLVCGKCALRVTIPLEIQTKQDLLNYFVKLGFQEPGKEIKICLDCEGRGWNHQNEFKNEEDWSSSRPIIRAREITKTVDCTPCRATGILSN